MPSLKFSCDVLFDALQDLPPCSALAVGLSGGLDSVVLLQALAQLRAQNRLTLPVRALHINHGLSPDAAQWQQHCERLCQQWQVPLRSFPLDLSAQLVPAPDQNSPPAGLENAARSARYQIFSEQLTHNEALLLAHHRDDQMETVLMRLLRGAGPKGLGGIPRTRQLGAGFLFRPLLGVDRQQLLAYATQQSLSWIEDESNADAHFDRNYCRHTVLPLLAARWPGYRDSWSKSAALQAEANELLQGLAADDLKRLLGHGPNVLMLDALAGLSKARQRNVLRYWLTGLNLPEPGWHDLQQLADTVVTAPADAAIWRGKQYQLSRHQNTLVALAQMPVLDTHTTHHWNPLQQPSLPLPGNGSLLAKPCAEDEQHLGLALSANMHVRYRQGGERCQLRSRPGRALKKVLHEHKLPPWVRARLPLLYAGEELLCVPGVGVTAAAASTPQPLYTVHWQQPNWLPGAVDTDGD